MKCVQFFPSLLPSVENFLENWNILPLGRTWSRFSFENRERNLCGVSAARLSRIHSNWMNPLSVVRPHNTLLSPAGRGRCFLPRSNFPRLTNIYNPKINEIYTINYFILSLYFRSLLFQQFQNIINISFPGQNSKVLQRITEKSFNVFSQWIEFSFTRKKEINHDYFAEISRGSRPIP